MRSTAAAATTPLAPGDGDDGRADVDRRWQRQGHAVVRRCDRSGRRRPQRRVRLDGMRRRQIVVDFENVSGSDFVDTIRGTGENNDVTSGKGRDAVRGRGRRGRRARWRRHRHACAAATATTTCSARAVRTACSAAAAPTSAREVPEPRQEARLRVTSPGPRDLEGPVFGPALSVGNGRVGSCRPPVVAGRLLLRTHTAA